MSTLNGCKRGRGGALALAAAVSIVLASCSSGPEEVEEGMVRGDADPVQVQLTDAKSSDGVRESTRSLGLEVMAEFPGETMVMSPASAVVALSMLGTGASGTAEEELSQLLGAEGQARDEAVNALMATLDPYRADLEEIDPEEIPEEPVLHLANQAVVSDQTDIEQDYLDSLAKWYDAGVLTTDLASPDSKKILDQWVNENTAGLIEESAVEPDPDLRLVLQNAVLLAAPWNDPFEEESTSDGEFATAAGETVTAEYMKDTRTIDYAENDGWKMIDLPYGTDGNLVARYVLPPEGTGLEEVTADDLSALESSLQSTLVRVTIPKLDLSSSIDLKDPLIQQGLASVFSFTPPVLQHISPEELYVTLIVQQGKVRVDEEGTVAAAVTEIGVEAGSAPGPSDEPAEFRAERPHLVLLLDETVGWDLFQIAVNDPTVE
ncbi:serpin family protein [Actinomycetaceae bacterium L2_0104]